MKRTFWIETKYISPVNLINRKAAATGSVSYAGAAMNADYNGHMIEVLWNDYRGYWIASYRWAGDHKLYRGKSLREAIEAAVRFHERSGEGSEVLLRLPSDVDAESLIEEFGFEPMPENRFHDHRPSWWTGTHEAVRDSLRWGKGLASYHDLLAEALKYEGEADEWGTHRDAWLKGWIENRRKEMAR